MWLVCHYQAMGGPEQSRCNFGNSWLGLSSIGYCQLKMLFSKGGSHGGSWILGTGRPGEDCARPTTHCEFVKISFTKFCFWKDCIQLNENMHPLNLFSAHDGQEQGGWTSEDAVWFHRLCVLVCVQGKSIQLSSWNQFCFCAIHICVWAENGASVYNSLSWKFSMSLLKCSDRERWIGSYRWACDCLQ